MREREQEILLAIITFTFHYLNNMNANPAVLDGRSIFILVAVNEINLSN